MGARGSTLVGKAQPDSSLLPYTVSGAGSVSSILERHRHDLGGAFALGPKQFAMLLAIPEKEAVAIFRNIYDTDRNSLVDAFEVIGSVAMLSKMSIPEKVDLIYSLYDFNGSGDITLDEMTILLKTLVSGCAKMDKKISPPSTEETERLAVKAFSTADKDMDGEISKHEFDAFCYSHPMCKDFLDYWRGAMNQVVLNEGETFDDNEFQPDATSLFTDIDRPPAGLPPGTTIEWRRPSAFCPEDPVLFTAGPAKDQLRPGSMSNKWFVSALALVSANPQLVKNLFVHTGQESHGRYCVRFYKQGTWVNAIIDDQIPFNRARQPLFVSGADKNELAPMLIEKAYAKIHGSYQSLIDGKIEYALKDLTGGVPDVVDTNEDPKFAEKVVQGKFWIDMKKKLGEGLFGAVSNNPPVFTNQFGEQFPEVRNGIVKGLAYPVLGFAEVNEKRLRLVKVGNPWGLSEFDGDWGNNSPLWEENADVARQCKKQSGDTSVFWMTQDDFTRIFNMHYFTKLMNEEEWQVVRHTASFPKIGGGCFNFPSWVQNEQILLDVEEDSTEIVITVTQKDDRYHKDNADNRPRPHMGIIVHEHKFGDVDLGNVQKLLSVNSTGIVLQSPFLPARDVTVTGTLSLGRYCVVPQTFDPDSGIEYTITIHSKQRINVYCGSEVDWDPETAKLIEGKNEMEQDLSKGGEVGGTTTKNSFEEDNTIVAIQAAAKMVAELTVMARQLEQKKQELTTKLTDLEAQVERKI
jgi:Ca2+-binding EF-hand superfamily protein